MLNDRKRVVFPGFGNLEVREVTGELSRAGGKINPPGLAVKFDSGYSKDDGMLAATLAYGEEMQPEEAGQRVLELVDAIKFSLDKGEPYQIHETGIFLKDDDGKVHFQVASDWVLEPDQYGLESLDLLELEELPPETEQTKEALTEKAPPVSGAQPGPGRASFKTAESQPAQSHVKQSNRWRAIYITAGILIVILAVLIIVPTGRKSGSGIIKKKAPVESPPQNGALPVESEQAGEAAAQRSQSAAPETVKVPTESMGNQADQVEAKPKYYLIAGSFKNLKNASDMQDQLKARGFQSEVLITENRMYRVSVASYATEAQAEEGLSKLTSEPGLKSCWILSN